MKQNWLFAALPAAALLSGCCMMLEDPAEPVIDPIVEKHQALNNRPEELALLQGKAWIPTFIKGQENTDGRNKIALPDGQYSYLIFGNANQVEGCSGVNTFSGTYIVTAPDRLRFGAIKTTAMAGTHLDYEMLMLAQLNSVDHFRVLENGNLEMYSQRKLFFVCRPESPEKVKGIAQKTQVLTAPPEEPKDSVVAPMPKETPRPPEVMKTDDVAPVDKEAAAAKAAEKAAVEAQAPAPAAATVTVTTAPAAAPAAAPTVTPEK